METNKIVVGIIIYVCLLVSCKKQDEWLDVKKNKADVVPTTLSDFQMLLNYSERMNGAYPIFGFLGADNYHLLAASWESNSGKQLKNAYIWASDIYEGEADFFWVRLYEKLAYTNVVLDGIKSIKPDKGTEHELNRIKGSALFFRALFHYYLAGIWAKPYDSLTSSTDLGIPLKLSSDIHEKANRGTVESVYNQILLDLIEAASILPVDVPFKTIPSKTAAESLLARVYLNMDKYDSAAKYSELAINRSNFLYNFSEFDSTKQLTFPTFQQNNKELIFYAESQYSNFNAPGIMFIDSGLLALYDPSDLRRALFYYDAGVGISFKGSYTGNIYHFAGIGINEIYFIRAESLARLGFVTEAMADLNFIMKARWRADNWVDRTAVDAADALKQIVIERRKELPFTGQLRWEDLRRWNKDKELAITLKREINGQSYSLPPNDPRYVYPIPMAEILMSGLPQNPR